MSKRTLEDAGKERVSTKSMPMMNLVSRYSVSDPNVLASTTSEIVQCAANRYGETRNAGCRPRVFLCCFSPCLCHITRDVAHLSELIVARDAQSPFVGARDTSVCCVQDSSQFSFR